MPQPKAPRHHYVPRFLVKHFAHKGSRGDMVHYYRRETGKITTEPVCDVFQSRGRFSHKEDESLEKAWGKIEDRFARLCERAIAMEAEWRRGIRQRFQEGDTNLAIRAFGMQFIRSSAKFIAATKHVEERGHSVSEAKALYVSVMKDNLANLLAFAKGEFETDNPKHYIAHLSGKKLIGVLTPNPDIRYVLGDWHVQDLCPIGGAHRPEETSFVMPVSPTFALALVPGGGVFRPDAAPGGLTGEFNRLSMSRSDEVVAKESADIEDLKWRLDSVPAYALYY